MLTHLSESMGDGSSALLQALPAADDASSAADGDGAPRRVRIFISSPGDVRPERLIAQRIIERLDREFAYHFQVEPVLWERKPLVASKHFQDSITPPHETDIVVVILWSRLGVPLPNDAYPGPLSGGVVTGTEWEFEDALASQKASKLPDVLFYRKTAPVMASLEDDAQLEQQRLQKRQVDAFLKRWFFDVEAGTFTAAFRDFAAAAEFEAMLEEHLRELLLKRIIDGGERGGPASIRWLRGSPYRGLESFDLGHAQVFFGRTRARNQLRELLARKVTDGCAFVLVFGASGSGKSSLVKAGLLPDLKLPGMIGRVALCRHLVLRPADVAPEVLAGLGDALLRPEALPELSRLGHDGASLGALLAADPRGAAEAIRCGLDAAAAGADLTESAEARLVVIIDQLEELFTLERLASGERDAFVATLEALATSGVCWIVATMRSDFFDRLESAPALARLSSEGARYLLTPPDVAEFSQIIRRPAREAGVQFEFDRETGVGLDETLLEAALAAPSALPVLAFTLDQLWQRRTDQGVLTFAAYAELGGLEGALGQRAEETFATLPAEVQAALPEVLRAVATASQDVQVRISGRAALLSAFPPETPRRHLVDCFLAADVRLLIADGDAEGARVRLAHEALLTRWDRARQLLLDDCADLQIRARLEQAAVRWSVAEPLDRDSLLLHAGRPLAEGQSLLARRRAELDRAIIDYVEASTVFAEAGARRKRRRLRLIATAFAALSMLAGSGAVAALIKRHEAVIERNRANAAAEKATVQQQIAQEKLEQALRNQSLHLAGAAQHAIERSHFELAMLLSLEALPADPDRPERPIDRSAVSALYRAVQEDSLKSVLPQGSPAIAAAFSPRGDRIVTTSQSGTAEISRVRDGGLVVRLAHEGPVLAAAFAPAGDSVVTASQDATARLWDAETGALRSTYKHDGGVVAVAFAPRGDRIATASLDGTARVWGVAADAPILTLRHGDAVRAVRFNPAADRIVTASDDGSAAIWNAVSGARVATLKHRDAVLDAAFSPNGEFVATASEDYTARLWRAQTGALVRSFKHAGVVRTVAFSPDGALLVSASNEGAARLWRLDGVEATRPLEHDDWVSAAVFSPAGDQVATISSDGTAKLWDASDGDLLATLRHDEAVRSVCFDDTGDLLVTTSDDAARVWSAAATPDVVGLDHAQRATAAVFDPSGDQTVTASLDGSIRVWDSRTGARQQVIGTGGPLLSVALSPDGKTIVSGGEDGRARIWDRARGAQVAAVPHGGAVSSVRFAASGEAFVTASRDGTARVVDARTGRERAVLAHPGWVYAAAFDPTGAAVVTTAADDAARIWDARTGAETAILRHGGVIDVAVFSPSGELAATASQDHTARVWNARTGALLLTLHHQEPVKDVVFSPSGDRIATPSNDRTVRLWRTADGAALATLPHQDWVQSVAFNNNGKSILTASHDGTIRLWDGQTGLMLSSHTIDAFLVSAMFSPDGDQIAAVASSNIVHLIKSSVVSDVSALIDYAHAAVVRNLTDAERETFFVPAHRHTRSPTARDAETTGPATAPSAAVESEGPADPVPADCADPATHQRLAERFEDAGDPETALFHHILAAQFWLETGADRQAAEQAVRRGTLARSLREDVVVRVSRSAREARREGGETLCRSIPDRDPGSAHAERGPLFVDEAARHTRPAWREPALIAGLGSR